MKKLLYLHGLNSTLHLDRKQVLQQYNVEIIAPELDYEGDPNVWNQLLDMEEVDLVIGSSAGGLAGYYYSGFKQLPALLFNPALPFRHYFKLRPELSLRKEYLQIVLGAQDTDVPARQTFNFLNETLPQEVPMEIHWINQMEHSLPIVTFAREVDYFMERTK